ncbi:EF-hand domain-containing family member C2 isoform X4 [Muntiacus reevesi]|uniref:EF-hand domain-containing family member C2 isoform X4 n=1 Tax=Muntiacus reevesi TaxID=9886 RepID=UPI0033077254
MALPLLPGNSFNRNMGKEKFHKSQHWGFCNNVRMLVSEDKPGIGGELLFGQKIKPKYSVFPKGMGIDMPSWVAFDKQVLSFDAYLEDEVPDKSQENYRIRRYKIYFYLEDDTIEVNEPVLKNSGLPQGLFIRRHRISLPPPDDDHFYTVYHFNVNTDIVFYGRTFKIYDCDAFTRSFLRKIGVKLNPPGQCPEDPYMKTRREKLDYMGPLRPCQSFDTLKQFLEYDRKVLRFFCVWDDSCSVFGDRRELILHYFLSDDTVEIKEILPHNSGRDAMSLFLQRRKLPKYGPPGVFQPGQLTDQTVLNVYGGYSENRVYGYLLDKYNLGKLDQEFYKDTDLSIGTTINVWGRKVLLCDCDDFTKTYYRTKYGIGYTGGMFLKRFRVKKPGQEVFKSEFSEYIKAEELYVGAKVNVNGYLFLLVNADEYTLNYMERNSDKFPLSSIELALQKLKEEKPKSRELKQVFIAADCMHTTMVDFNTFREIMMNLTVGKLTDQEVITIARHYRVPEDPCPDRNVLLAQAHQQLKKNTFENFERLIATCVYQDREKKKVLPSKDIKRLCKSFRLPLNEDLLGSLLSRFEDSEKQINYESFFCALNWRVNPVPELGVVSYIKERCEDEWLGMPSPIPVKGIYYLNLLKDVFGSEEE